MGTKAQDEYICRIPEELWQGTVIAIDPSCGSQSSMPAYALARGGYVVNSDRIEIPLKVSRKQQVSGYENGEAYPLHLRLWELQTQLRGICLEPDIVILEDLPPFMASKGGDFRTGGVVRLHQSAGCIMSTWCCPYIVPIAIKSHQTLIQKLTGGKYVKTDENDALSILLSAFHQANVELKNEKELLEYVTKSG